MQRAPLLTLPQDVAERIAAGEVIERPVSVIKELVENALDAGARDIRIEVRDGGRKLIRVTDDGCGIPENELERVCLRHTTSKMCSVEDLDRLCSLGFRGEALASIAAVAEVTLFSRAIETITAGEERAALWVTLRAGEVILRGKRARLQGATVTVRDLFYNVPARLKWTHISRTENGHIMQLIQRFAAGYPTVRFHLLIEERTVLQTSGTGALAVTLAELYHLPFDEMLQEVCTSAGEHYKLHGAIGNRVLAQKSRQYITLFVNGRLVQVRALQDALEQGYRGLLPRGKHPLLVLYLAVPPDEVDVNVHPAKTEVRLLRENEIKVALQQVVRSVLEQSPALPAAVQFPGPALVSQRRLPGPRRRGLRVGERVEDDYVAMAQPDTAEVIASLRPLAQLQQAVILAEAPDGSLYLIDQHRAHERIIYEDLCFTYAGVRSQDKVVDAHLLLEPVIVEMKPHQAELLEMRLPLLRGLGLACEHFGGHSFLIRSLPNGEGQEQLLAHLHELVEVAAEESADWEDRLLIGLACRSAMRRGRILSPGEQAALLKALARVSAPAVCPHGSPILLYYSRTFLMDKFAW
jgi:DNA mismatch repair protein MutL